MDEPNTANPRYPKLKEMAEHYKLIRSNGKDEEDVPHCALQDVELTSQVYLRVKNGPVCL